MSCFCIPPYSASPDNSDCVLISTASTIGSISTTTALKATTSGVFGLMGTIFYENITSLNFPIITSANTGVFTTENGTPLSNTTFWVDASGRVLNLVLGGPGEGENLISPYINLPSTYFGPEIFPSRNDNTSVWGRNSTFGRLNFSGLWPSNTNPFDPIDTWIGFTYCLDIASAQTYYIGVAADDYFRLKLNGNLLLQTDLSPSVSAAAYKPYGINFATWSVFPITLQAGQNYIELEGRNAGGTAAFGAEIYSGDLATLTAVTTPAEISALTIFTTADLIGQIIPNVGDSGFTCPKEYVLNSCGSPSYCVRVLRKPCYEPVTTTTTTRGYLTEGYLPVNDCNVLTISPMIVSCDVTNITGKVDAANGSITLNISGGTAPYTIVWQYPNGVEIVGPPTINGLSVGTYSATIRDYYGDFIVTTSCSIPGFTTTTSTTTTTIPPISGDDFCLTIELRSPTDQIIKIYQFNFIPGPTINGQPSWISDPTGQEIVYYNPSVPTNGGWSLSGSPTSDITLDNIIAFNSNPSYPPIAGINPNFVAWTVIVPLKANSTITATEGLCF